MRLSLSLEIISVLSLIICYEEASSSPVEYIYHHSNNHDIFNTPHHVFHHEYDGYDDSNHNYHDNGHQHPPSAGCSLHVNTYPNNADVYTGPIKQPYYNNQNHRLAYVPPPASYSATRNYNYNPRNQPYPSRRYAYQGIGSRTNYYVPVRNRQTQSTLNAPNNLVSDRRYYDNNGHLNSNYYGDNYAGYYGYKK